MRSMSRCMVLALVLGSLLAACTGGTTLVDASSPGCPAEPSGLSGSCGTAGQVCLYSNVSCPQFSYVCVASDGGAGGTWQANLCE